MTDTRILQLTDLHLFCDVDSTLKGIPTRKTLQSVVDAIRKEEGELDRVVITGDHTHDEQPESYKIARGFFEPWIERLAIVPGNHDDRAVMQSVFGDVIERQATGPVKKDDRIVFSFHCGQWLCLGLDTRAPGEVAGHFGERQADWLRAQLSEHGDNPSMLFCHHPPIDIGSEWMDRNGLKDRHRLLDVVQDYSSVRLICCGHVHHESEGHVGHVRVVTTPSTGIQFDPRGSKLQFANDPPGYRIIELIGDQLKTRVARLPQADHTPTPA